MIIVREPAEKIYEPLSFICKNCRAMWKADQTEAKMTIGYKIFGLMWYTATNSTYTMRCPFCKTRNKIYSRGYYYRIEDDITPCQ